MSSARLIKSLVWLRLQIDIELPINIDFRCYSGTMTMTKTAVFAKKEEVNKRIKDGTWAVLEIYRFSCIKRYKVYDLMFAWTIFRQILFSPLTWPWDTDWNIAFILYIFGYIAMLKLLKTLRIEVEGNVCFLHQLLNLHVLVKYLVPPVF